MTDTKLTDERPDNESLEILITLRKEIAERHAKEGHMAQCAVHTAILNALLELQERRKADNAEPIYQCEFCHHDTNGDLQWHWEDVNKDFYDQYDSGRRGHRRILYAAPQPTPVIPEEIEPDSDNTYDYVDGWNACRAAMLSFREKSNS
ncbi:hypothetical protein N5D10_16055 [Citrobacter freundii]|uniref:hypothetical protein n=1 Tax=Citrobacter freundii TaxID=546 RepID=UPI0024483908|nr:hypothetical protein [Citrobacter freundii]MDH0784730.1 hypothetical protein [Citrobacter freundii]